MRRRHDRRLPRARRPELVIVRTRQYGLQAVLEIPKEAIRSCIPGGDAVLVYASRDLVIEWGQRMQDGDIGPFYRGHTGAPRAIAGLTT